MVFASEEMTTTGRRLYRCVQWQYKWHNLLVIDIGRTSDWNEISLWKSVKATRNLKCNKLEFNSIGLEFGMTQSVMFKHNSTNSRTIRSMNASHKKKIFSFDWRIQKRNKLLLYLVLHQLEDNDVNRNWIVYRKHLNGKHNSSTQDFYIGNAAFHCIFNAVMVNKETLLVFKYSYKSLCKVNSIKLSPLFLRHL